MASFVELLLSLIFNYPLFQYCIVFLGAAFGGEIALISLSFLAAQNVFPIIPFFIVSFFGTLFSDILWFLLGRTKTVGKILTHRYATRAVSIVVEAIQTVSRGNHLIAFIFAKFLTGTRILVIFYVSRTNLSIKKFVQYDLLAVFIWVITLTAIGYLSGLGFVYVSRVLKNIYAGIGLIVLVLFVIAIIQAWLKKVIIKKREEIIKKDNL